MSRHLRHRIRTTRRSVLFNRGRGDAAAMRNAQLHMFSEDVSFAVMPYGRPAAFAVTMTPQSREVESAVAHALPRRGARGDLVDAVCDFFRTTTQLAVTWGAAPYEITYPIEKADDDPFFFELELIDPETLQRRHNRLYQAVPADIAQHYGVGQYNELLMEDVHVFRLPEPYRAERKRALQGLTVVGSSLMPSFAMPNSRGGPNVPFEFESYRWNYDVALAGSTSAFGWAARESLAPRMLPFYHWMRRLRFERALAAIRDELTSTLNGALARAGGVLDFQATIEIHGLRTVAEIDLLTSELQEGVSFEELNRSLR
jgi:hypothetical protein